MDEDTLKHLKRLLNAINESDSIYDQLYDKGVGFDIEALGREVKEVA